jgi:hypothetical protein
MEDDAGQEDHGKDRRDPSERSGRGIQPESSHRCFHLLNLELNLDLTKEINGLVPISI